MFLKLFKPLAILSIIMIATPTHANSHHDLGYNMLNSHIPIRFGIRMCGRDVARLCRNVFPGGGRIIQCLNDNLANLSPNCRDLIEKRNTRRNAFFACNKDASTHCPGILPGGGRVISCLIDKQDLISESCRNALIDLEQEYGR